MTSTNKFKKFLNTKRGQGEVQDWIFSLTPITVAFVFYYMLIVTSEIDQKGLFIAYGASAGVIGLQSYWIMRGWRNNHTSTILLGIVGIAITVAILSIYLSFI